MKNWKKIAGIIVVAVVAGGGYYGYKQYTDGPVNIASAKAITVNAAALLDEYTKSEAGANKKYIGKILSVTGEVIEVIKNQEGQTVVTFKTADPMNSINCTMEQQGVSIKPGTTITIKGLCTGYMMDVYLTRCYLVK
jgi:tRNA_anti-like